MEHAKGQLINVFHFRNNRSHPESHGLVFGHMPQFLAYGIPWIKRGKAKLWSPLDDFPSNCDESPSRVVTAFVMTLPVGLHPGNLPDHFENYARVFYANHAETGKGVVWTVVIHLAKPIPVEDWPQAFGHINLWFGGFGSSEGRDPLRAYPMADRFAELNNIYAYYYPGKSIDLI